MVHLKARSIDQTSVRLAGRLRSYVPRRLRRRWASTTLSLRFLIVAAPVVVLAMVVLGDWASGRIEYIATRSAAEAGAIFLQAFLEPYVQNLPAGGSISPSTEAELDDVLANNDVLQRFIMLKIWNLDTTLLYSSRKDIVPMESVEQEIRTAAAGDLARHFEELDEEVRGISPKDNVALLEVYAPLYKTGTNEIIAVGEFYQSADALLDNLSQTRLLTWAVVGGTTITMLWVLYLIVAQGSRTIERQRATLERQFKAAERLASQNNALRRIAERARVEASEANENFLSSIGADIHDGPIQILSMLLLSLQYGRDGEAEAELQDGNGAPADQASTIRLAKSLHSELRSISTGLILPEIPNATLPEVFTMAVRRHEATTGDAVALALRSLPDEASVAVKICCYRIVQEGLNNGHRHGGGKGLQVIAGASKDRLRIMILDQGDGFNTTAKPGQRGLGLLGMRNRVKALKGKLRVLSMPGRGARIYVTMPLDPEA